MGVPLHRMARVAIVSSLVFGAACNEGGERAEVEESRTTTQAVEIGPVATTELVTGDCITGVVIGLQQRIEMESASVVDCNDRHDLEVFNTFEVTADMLRAEDMNVYPGRGRVIGAAEVGCNDALAATGIDTELLGAIAFWPSAASWDQGDRTVACAIYLQNGRPFDGRQLRLEDAEDTNDS